MRKTQLTIRLRPKLMKRLKKEAQDKEFSLAEYIERIIDSYLPDEH